MITIKSAKEIVKMQKAGEIVAFAHRAVADAICIGISTEELDRIAYNAIISKGAQPSFLNYNGYPSSICASINDVVIHGIPSNTIVLKERDIVSIDIGAYYDGYHSDRAVTHGVGTISETAKLLIQTAENAFYAGIDNAREGQRISDISAAIQRYVERKGFSVVKDFVGHGIGTALHEKPDVPNFVSPGKGLRLYRGMTIAVEPMINVGRSNVRISKDGWTVTTIDGSLSAHYEHSIAITGAEPLLLTVER
ncbi:MAG: type I methionyl aminopeptidase [Clostridiaceae bacterium]|jgi:methionyl aminopeptidase|nr:type I methionyl aminopeptidase [Clostridiaceae bacterium]